VQLPKFLPDLEAWHQRNTERGTLLEQWKGLPLEEICRELGVPAWRTARPWRTELPGIAVRTDRGPEQRTLTWETPRGTLTSRWSLGPDGDWWRTEYPVKTAEDLPAALAVARARRYVVEQPAAQVTEDSLTALELPYRPWSELFHSFLGWSEGLMLFMEEPSAVREIAQALEEALRPLVDQVASLPGRFVLSPDNLDGQFITAEAFEENLAPSYRSAAAALHAGGKQLIVHAGGPVRRLLPGLAACGIDCIQGICAAPQGDSTLAEARALCGPSTWLWGGIAQDFLLASRTDGELAAAAKAALDEARTDPRAVVGVSDKIPVDAVPQRLTALFRMVLEGFNGR
jgi:hypothetical protein